MTLILEDFVVLVPRSMEADHVTADLSPTFHSPTRLCFGPEVLQRDHTHTHHGLLHASNLQRFLVLGC